MKILKGIKVNPIFLGSFIITITAIFLTIGFSAYQLNMEVDGGNVAVRIQKNIRITGFGLLSSTADAVSYWEEYNHDNIASSINLPNSNSTVTYNVEITNVGNIEASISNILNLPSNLKYTLKIANTLDDYDLNDMLCDDSDSTICKQGSVTTLSMTIGYDTNGYDSSKTDYTIDMDFIFKYITDAVALMNNRLYDTLGGAIGAINTSDETNILLLNDTSEIITIGSTKNIVLDLNEKTLSNVGNNPVISNEGTLHILNGTITSNAPKNGAVNNQSTGTVTISSGKIIVTGGRQALWNNKGRAKIEGSAYLKSESTERGAVQNVSPGVMEITGGKIISTGFSGLVNAGTLTIGVKNDSVDITTPVIEGINYGLETSSNLEFYDGLIRGQNAERAIDNESKVSAFEDGYALARETKTIDGVTYQIAFPGFSNTITFNPKGGVTDEPTRYVVNGKKIGTLPSATKTGNIFDGWYTEETEGVKIDANYVVTGNKTFYAHWIKITDIARIGNTSYDTVQAAVNAASGATPVTITLMKSTSESITINSTKNIVIDLNNLTLSNFGGSRVVTNEGNVTFINGTISSDAGYAAIDNNGGTLIISTGARIIATGTRQAIYINDGTVRIENNAYLSSQTSGKPDTSSMERGTVQCLSDGTLIITGGTIEGLKQQAVSNEGTLIIGEDDGDINSASPVIIGKINGIKTSGIFNYYDGIIKGGTNTIDGTITGEADNSRRVTGTEIIDSVEYHTVYIESFSN